MNVTLLYRYGLCIRPAAKPMALVALLSNPRSTGNISQLPRVRSFCANEKDIFHYEVEEVDQIAQAMRTIARVKPKVIVLNGGDGTVQAALTELYQGGHFGGNPPPVAVLPNGKTNLIAQDLGANGDPIAALERVLELARTDMAPHIVERELIALVRRRRSGPAGARHVPRRRRARRHDALLPQQDLSARPAQLAGARADPGARPGRRADRARRRRFLPPPSRELTVSVTRSGVRQGRFSLADGDDAAAAAVQRLAWLRRGVPGGSMQMLLIDRSFPALMRAFVAGIRGRLGRERPVRRPSRARRRDQDRGRALQRHPRRRDVRGRYRPADRAAADLAGVVPQARRLTRAGTCRTPRFAFQARRSSR